MVRIDGQKLRMGCGLAAVCLLAVGCRGPFDPFDDDGRGRIVGSGVLVNEVRAVEDFHAVEVRGVGRLVIDRTGEESLEITADENLLPFLRSEVVDGRLRLGTDRDLDSVHEPVYRLTVRDLDALVVKGVVSAEVTGLDTELFEVDISGVSAVEVEGRAGGQRVEVSGVSGYAARELTTRETLLNASGVFTIEVTVSDELRGSACGPGTVRYFGQPVIRLRTCVETGLSGG